LPTSCDDGDSCTKDFCDPVSSCLHLPICRDGGADASADARPDGPVDSSSSPDLAADAPPIPGDTGGLVPTDASVVVADAAPGTDAAPAPRDVAVDNVFREGDARTLDEPLGTQSLGDGGGTLAPVEAGSGTAGPDAGLGATADALAVGDGAGVTGEAGAGTDARKLTNDLNGGCSCRLNASSSPQVSGLWAVLALGLFARLARRRRRGP
jgi:MYXO-CTERM domain-containing protein